MKLYKLKVYQLGLCDIEVFLVKANSPEEAIGKLRKKGFEPDKNVEEIMFDCDDVSLLMIY